MKESLLNMKLEECSKLEFEKNEHSSIRTKLEMELKTIMNSNDHLKKIYDELESRKSTEVELLEKEYNAQSLNLKDYKSQLQASENEIEDLKEENRKLMNELEIVKTEGTQMMKLIEENNIKTSEIKENEKRVEIFKEEYKKKLDDLSILKEELLVKERQYQKTITKLQNENNENQKERDNKFNILLETLKSQDNQIISDKEKEINSLLDRCNSFSIENDSLRSEIKVLRKDQEEMNSSITTMKSEYDGKYLLLNKAIKEKEEEKSTLERMFKLNKDSLQRKIKELEDSLKYSSSQKDQALKTLERERSNLDRQLIEAKKITNISSNILNEKENLTKENERITLFYESKLNEQSEMYKHKIEMMEIAMNNSLRDFRDREEKALILLRKQEELSLKWKSEHESSVKYFEDLISEYKKKMKNYKSKCFTLMNLIPSSEKEKLIGKTM